MKTNYDTPEDREHLEKILHRAIMATDSIYNTFCLHDPIKFDIKEYILQTLDLRAKIFEYLDIDDFNEETGLHKRIREKLQHERETTN